MTSHFRRSKYREEHQVIGPALDAIENAYNVLLALPDRDTTRFYRMNEHKAAADRGDIAQMWFHVFSDNYNWLKFFFYSSALKTRQLAGGLVDAYNADQYLTWLVLARASLEYAAVSYYYVKRILALDLDGPKFRVSQLSALEELMLQYAHGSRFNWTALLSGNIDALNEKYEPLGGARAVNVLTALSHLARHDERYKDVEVAYEMLSDFAHPNMASHSAVVTMPGPSTPMHECEIALAPGALRGEFLMVISLPWVSVGVGSVVENLIQLRTLMTKWLDYIEQGARIEFDLKG